MRYKLRGILPACLACLCLNVAAQKQLFHADSCRADSFPIVKGLLYHRGYGESILKKEQLEIQEDGKPVAYSLTDITNREQLPRNKRVLLLIENHYKPKGFAQRNFFANVISYGIEGVIKPGDKFMVSTFDWQRNGRYVFNEMKDFTDDAAQVRKVLSALAPRPPLQNTQDGSDINSSLVEAMKNLAPVADSLPTAIILFSDDLDNIAGKIVSSDVRNKALELNIPVYAVSYEMYSRYHPVIRDEICVPTYGRYYVSPTNNIQDAAAKLKAFLSDLVRDSRGTVFSFSYTTRQEKNGQKITLKFDVTKPVLTDTRIVDIPALSLKERITQHPLAYGGIVLGILLLAGLVIYYIRKTASRQRAQEKLARQTAQDLEEQKRKEEEEIRLRDEQIKLLQQQQQQKEKDEARHRQEEQRRKEEDRLVKQMLAGGAFPRLLYTYKDMNGSIEVSHPMFTIGRENSNHFFMQIDTVSRKHATISFDPAAGYSVTDHESANGTFVNGHRVMKTAPLKSGDFIQIGGVDIIFQC